ncbi:MAG: helix-turn-helix transcriptional regulator [Nitrospirota bacterium]
MRKRKLVTSREIGEKIRKRRSELKLSQQELADMLGVTYQQVQRYESGRNKLNAENIQIIAEALSVPVVYFFESAPAPTMMIAEERPPYAAPDESALLRHFRKIRGKTSRNIVIQVARLAAETKE